MNVTAILSQLRQERDRLDKAIAALESVDRASTRKPGRRGPRQMSAEARRRISEAQKKRWAERRKKR